MWLVVLILILILIILLVGSIYSEKNNNEIKEGFWYYPNCMETAFGGTRCYPYFYPNTYSYPLFPWYYPYTYYYPYDY